MEWLAGRLIMLCFPHESWGEQPTIAGVVEWLRAQGIVQVVPRQVGDDGVEVTHPDLVAVRSGSWGHSSSTEGSNNRSNSSSGRRGSRSEAEVSGSSEAGGEEEEEEGEEGEEGGKGWIKRLFKVKVGTKRMRTAALVAAVLEGALASTSASLQEASA